MWFISSPHLIRILNLFISLFFVLVTRQASVRDCVIIPIDIAEPVMQGDLYDELYFRLLGSAGSTG
jgi:hypothetical protein